MMPGQEANGDFRDFFFYLLDNNVEAILMSTHNKQFHDKIRKFP